MNSKLKSFRLTAYRRMNFEDTSIDDSVQDLHREWDESAEAVRHCSQCLDNDKSLSLEEKAEHLLTSLVCQQVGIRDYALLDQTIEAIYAILPYISSPRLRLHLLVHLYAESEDETLLSDIEAQLSDFRPTDEEDDYLLRTYHDVKECVTYRS